MFMQSYLVSGALFLLVFPWATEATNIVLPLHKVTPYESKSQFIDRVATYKEELQYFYSEGAKGQPVSKIDLNINYFANIQLGFGTIQRFSVTFDSTFSGLWIPSKDCKLSFNCWFRKRFYDSGDSIDYVPDVVNNEHAEITITYGETNFISSKNVISGKLGYDTLTMESVELPAVHFIEATSISRSPFNDLYPDGVLGLGYPNPAFKMAPPFFTMLDRGVLKEPIFSLYIGNSDTNGELTFGGYNQELIVPNTLQFYPMTMTESGMSINCSSIKMEELEFCENGCSAYVDMGTALIAAPKSVLNIMYQKIAKKNYKGDVIEVDCTKRWSMPTLNISIRRKTAIQLTGFDYTIQTPKNECVLGLMESPSNFWILGNLFLKKTYTVFDIGEMAMGFGKIIPGNNVLKLKEQKTS